MNKLLEERRLRDEWEQDMRLQARESLNERRLSRLDAVEQAFKLALVINKGGKYWCWYSLSPHVDKVTLDISPAGNSHLKLWSEGFYTDGLSRDADISETLYALRCFADGDREQRFFKAQEGASE